MTSAGYIHDQLCPIDPSHGKVLLPHGSFDRYYCPHAGHTPVDPEKWTNNLWTYDQWEAIKRETSTKSSTSQDPHPSRAVAVKTTKKSNVRRNRRRSR